MVAAFQATSAFAAPAVLVGSNSGSVGTANLSVSVDWDGDGTVVVAQFDIGYDNTELTPTNVPGTACSDGNWSCSIFAPGTIRFVSNLVDPLPDALIGNIDFDTSTAAVGTYPLNVSQQIFSDSNEGSVTPSGTTDGQIEIIGTPTYGSTPAPGNAIDLGAVVQDDTDPTKNLDIDNIGDANTTLTGSCVLGGANLGTFSLTPDSSFSILKGSGPDQTTITCDSGQAVGVHNATLTCTHDGDNASAPSQSPVIYALSCNIQAVPQPEYGSTPDVGGTLNMGVVTTLDPAPTADVTIENIGAPTTTLIGSCSVTTNPGGVYSVADGSFSLAQNATEVQTVTCDNSTPGDYNGGVLSCTHNGATVTSPALYTLNCEVQPVPVYGSTPGPGGTIDLGVTPQNNTPPTGALAINNDAGDADSTLSGICSLVNGTTPISISSGGNYSVLQGAAAALVGLTCDTARDQGTYSDTLSCTDNDPVSSDPQTYTVDCEIGPPDPAVYSSVPGPGATISLTPGGAVAENTDLTDAASLLISNAASPGDDFLDLQGCSVTAGDMSIITANPTPMNADIKVGDAAAVVNFSCDTTKAGNYSATYTCPFDENPSNAPLTNEPLGGVGSPATYTLQCDVRAAISEVTVEPDSGTTLPVPVDSGGTGSAIVVFTEVADEDANGKVSCTLDTDTDFHIISPTFPATIPAGLSVTVTVEGTDPGDGSSPTDTLRCTYTDTANSDPGVDVFYPLVLAVGGESTTIDVTKVFTDDNPGEVRVTLTCDTGLPLKQSFMISEGNGVKFVVTSFESGTMNCSVTEEATSAYSGTYVASGDSASVDNDPDAPGCHFLAIDGGDGNACSITNSPDSVEVRIEKEWAFAGSFSELEIFYKLTLYCDAEIVGGDPYLNGTSNGPASVSDLWYQEFEGTSPDNRIFKAEVIPGYPSSDCRVDEEVFSDAVEVDNGCGDLIVSAGNGDSCTVTNTVFFEGIPTLSQYGLAIMALLMLGIGMVGFRRFS